MPFAKNGRIRLFFEVFGEPGDPAVLLLNGAGKQAIDWPEDFCPALVEKSFRVIRFDQRDTGESTAFAGTGAAAAAAAIANGQTPILPYDADDLAADALAVMDTAGETRAHLFGRSLGAFITQLLVLREPTRFASMTLAMAFSGSIGAATSPERLVQLDAERVTDAAAFAERQVATARAIGNPDYFDEARIRVEAAAAFERGVHDGAIARHFMVGLAALDLRPRLADLTLPVQVIHGRMDKVIPLALAEETAAAIPGARLTVFDDMAHEAAPQLSQRWIDLFGANAARAEPI